MNVRSISPAELYSRLQSGERINLIDVRTAAEFREVHAAGARSVPLDVLTTETVGVSNGDPVYVICKSGGRSLTGCGKLLQSGLLNVVNVEGGTMAWQKAGLPVERGDGVGGAAGVDTKTSAGQIPIWRSNWVRLGGVLAVVLGIVLGLNASPVFLWIAGGVWLVMVLTGNGPCCWSSTCSTRLSRH